MLLARVAEVSRQVAAAPARSRKIALLAELFAEATPEESPLVIAYLSGRLPQGRIGVGWSTLKRVVPPAVPPVAAPALTLAEVDAALDALAGVAGPGAQAERARRVGELFAAATVEEQELLVRLLSGEVRQGALDAVALEGVAKAAAVPAGDLRRAVMLEGALPPVARAVLAEGPSALDRFTLQVGRPVQPMLAHTAGSVTEAVEALGPCAVEEKLDGIRIQVHREGERVRVHTRSLDDITARLPEVVAVALEAPSESYILDGELIALDPDSGRPAAFQSIAGRVGSRTDVGGARAALPLTPVFFDVLAADGEALVDRPGRERLAVL
ncbi:ATP-dependent DNA ligase, partial [Streptomyces hydrogenans]